MASVSIVHAPSPEYAAPAGRRAARALAAALLAGGLVLAAAHAEAQTVVSGPFSGTIVAGSTTQLVDGASFDGNVTNNGTLQFSLSLTNPISTTPYSISGIGNVLLTNTGTVTFDSATSYSNGTTINLGELVIDTGGSVSHPAADMTIGDLSGDNGVLQITGGGSLTTYNSILGNAAGSTGEASITLGTWTMSPSPGSPLPDGDFTIGYAGTGSLTMSGGTINVAGDSYIGRTAGSVGTATIASGTWDTSGSVAVGSSGGTGTLNINGGGAVIVGDTLTRDPTSGTINLNSGGTLSIGNGGTTGSLETSITNNGLLVFNRSTNYTYDAAYAISGTGSVVKQGAGSLTFEQANSYSGGTTIKAGEIVVASGGTISHAAAVLTVGDKAGDNGLLTISGGSVTTYDSTLGNDAGSSGTAVISSGTWTISPSPGAGKPAGDLNVGYAGTGSLTMSGGFIDVAGSTHVGRNPGGGGTFTMSSGTVAVGSEFQVGDGGTGDFTLTGGKVTSVSGYIGNNATGVGTATIASGTWDISADLKVGFNDGTGTLTINNGGVVIVGGDLTRDTLTGTINLNAGGTLVSGTGGTSGSLSTDLLNNGEVQFNRSDNYDYLNVISGAGSVVKDGAGKLTFSTANSYTGGTDIYGGTLEVTATGVINHPGANLNIDAGGIDPGGLSVIGGSVTAATINVFSGTMGVGGLGTVTSGSATIGNGLSNSGTVAVGGAGNPNPATWNIANGMTIGVNGGTGEMNIGAYGTVTTGDFGSRNSTTTLGAASGDSGTVTVGGDGTNPGTWYIYGNLAVGGGGTGALTISDGGSVLVTGTLSQGAAGTITVNSGGELRLGDGGTDGTLAATTLTNDGSLIFNRSTDTTTAASISGIGGLTKLNTNTLTLTGSSSYTGATALQAGKLYVNGELGNTQLTAEVGTLLGGSGTIGGIVTVFSGAVSPGAGPDTIGRLTVGGLVLDGSGDTATEKMTTFMSIAGTTAGVNYDQIAAVGAGKVIDYGGDPDVPGNSSILNLTISGTDFFPNFTQFQLFSDFTFRQGNFSEIVLNAAGTSYNGLAFTRDPATGIWSTPQNFDSLGYGQYLVFAPFDTTLDLGNDVGVPISGGSLVVVPEPGTLALAASGVVALFGAARWRRKQRKAAATDRPAANGHD